MPKPVDLTEKLSSWRTPASRDVEPRSPKTPPDDLERRLNFDFFTGLVFALLAVAVLGQVALLAAMG